jgi:methylthioribose-1-phosphate isomerase
MSAPTQHKKTLESIKYDVATLKLLLLDQRKLPMATVFDEVTSVEDVHTAIRDMRVRGAPAIAVFAALGVAFAAALQHRAGVQELLTVQGAKLFYLQSLEFVATSRPTAVNLFNAIAEMKAKVCELAGNARDGAEFVAAFLAYADRYYKDDVSYNERLMQFGAQHIVSQYPAGERIRILTICNTGALATARYGTALGVVRQLHYDGHLEQLYACETRPWNQGARLTVYECVEEDIPCTLICDSAAASLMRGSKKIHGVIVGADRICQNGDTANKIGTYSLAVAAKHHGVPFYVAAPTTTLDAMTASGGEIHIEERAPTEMTHNPATGERVVREGPHLSIWNPVFDVTPGELITGGIITEKGVHRPAAACPFYDIRSILQQ